MNARVEDRTEERRRMVAEQIAGRGVRDARVLEAMRTIPREAFLPPSFWDHAYEDRALPIACGQTISQPYVVGAMAEALDVRPEDRVLEIGCGSGYAAAVLAELATEVFGIERHETLAREALARLRALGYRNVFIRHGDGTEGWAEHAPYDAIMVSAAAPDVPPALRDQLADAGRLVIPIGASPMEQRLVRFVRGEGGELVRETLFGVRFVPLIGGEGWASEDEAYQA
ncbi:MAG: protein-L-isoaspartate(D-aspartate) O-methyltransferase [Planctomycetota bacterium]|jgi:protein-L-isoaspartate(D-aspartate) O-methyltransferase